MNQSLCCRFPPQNVRKNLLFITIIANVTKKIITKLRRLFAPPVQSARACTERCAARTPLRAGSFVCIRAPTCVTLTGLDFCLLRAARGSCPSLPSSPFFFSSSLVVANSKINYNSSTCKQFDISTWKQQTNWTQSGHCSSARDRAELQFLYVSVCTSEIVQRGYNWMMYWCVICAEQPWRHFVFQ